MRIDPQPRPEAVLAAVAHRLAERAGPAFDRSRAGPLLDGSIEPLGDEHPFVEWVETDAGPDVLGDVLEAVQGRHERRVRGAFYTSSTSAATVMRCAIDGWVVPSRPQVCDPACGGGALLLAAARWLEGRGLSRDEIVGALLHGADTDPLAVATTRAALALWCGGGGADTSDRVVVADTLAQGLDAWPARDTGFDLTVGNPPFQGQLAARTTRSRSTARRLEARFGTLARGYADSATLFLAAAAAMTRSGGRVAMIQPESFLAARDAQPVRRAMADTAPLVGIWLPRVALFEASVRVCVPVLEVGARPSAPVQRWTGVDAEVASPTTPRALDAATWAPLVADLLGVPAVSIDGDARVGDLADATAGFRDQFYGLRPFVAPASTSRVAGPRLLTSGAIDPVHELWAHRVVTFAGERFDRPVVDLGRLREEAPALARWAAPLLVPKLLVATQTRVVELVVDETGDRWPSVPVIAVTGTAEILWRLAAALSSPAVSAWCLERHAGTGLSGDAVKLSAKQVLDVPLPARPDAWDEGVARLRAAGAAADEGDAVGWRDSLEGFAEAMGRAYCVDGAVADWWLDRLPPFRA